MPRAAHGDLYPISSRALPALLAQPASGAEENGFCPLSLGARLLCSVPASLVHSCLLQGTCWVGGPILLGEFPLVRKAGFFFRLLYSRTDRRDMTNGLKCYSVFFFSTGQAAVFIYEKETNKKYFQLEWNLAIKVAVAHFLPFRPRIYVRYFGIFTQRKDSPRALLRMGIYTRRGLLRSVSQDLNRRGNLYRRDLECRCHSPLKFETNNFQVEA